MSVHCPALGITFTNPGQPGAHTTAKADDLRIALPQLDTAVASVGQLRVVCAQGNNEPAINLLSIPMRPADARMYSSVLVGEPGGAGGSPGGAHSVSLQGPGLSDIYEDSLITSYIMGLQVGQGEVN